MAERRTLEMELLRLIETTERGRQATRGQHAAILQIVGALERGFQVRVFFLCLDVGVVYVCWVVVVVILC